MNSQEKNIIGEDIILSLIGFILSGFNHGYSIKKKLSEDAEIGGVWKIKSGKLYTLLNKLEDATFLTSKMEHAGNRPPRKIYSTTSKGKKIFDQWLSEPVFHGRDFRIHFLLKLYFSLKTNIQNTQRLIEKQIAMCNTWLQEYQQDIIVQDKIKFNMIVENYRYSQIRGYIDWMESIKTILNEV